MKLRLASTVGMAALAATVLVSSVVGCDVGSAADQTDDLTAAPSATPVYAEPASDTATSVAVKNGMTLTMHASLAWHATTGGLQLVLSGSTSLPMTEVYGFIPDDGFGTSTQLGPKSFQLVFDNASDIDTVVSGSPFYLKMTTHSAAGDQSWSAQLVVMPRLVAPAGQSTKYLTLGPAITPVAVSTNPEGVVFRGTAAATSTLTGFGVTADSAPTISVDSTRRWHFDWDFSHFESAAPGHAVVAKANVGSTAIERDGTIEIRVAKVGLALGGSPDDIYGFPTCDPAVAACLKKLPAGTTDFGACGSLIPVRTCQDQQ